jgi:hypothetical protein
MKTRNISGKLELIGFYFWENRGNTKVWNDKNITNSTNITNITNNITNITKQKEYYKCTKQKE